ADRFDHEETRIIVYDDAPEQLAAAEQIRDLLGVGRVELSRTPQSVADITVVVGLDMLERG
ncbi:MAG: LytR C-terminal domain-containing protein, partial [Actinobacteria bacterium]|nr:LytR C-terminal domain-containing protein [Actinomycetota bacterium]